MKFIRKHYAQGEIVEPVDVADHAALVAHVAALLPNVVVTADALHVAPYGFDARLGWNAHIVTVDDFGVVGFTDGPVDP